MDMDISMDIHEKSVDMDMDMDVIFHIHGNPAPVTADSSCELSLLSAKSMADGRLFHTVGPWNAKLSDLTNIEVCTKDA